MKRLMIILLLLASFLPIHADIEVWEGNITDIQEPGTYYVKVSTTNSNGELVSTLVKTVITSDNTIIIANEAIDAHDFQVGIGEVSSMGIDAIIRKSKAKAWNVETGARIPISQMTINRESTSSYAITLATDSQLSITIRAIEKEDTPITWDTLDFRPQEFKNISNRYVQLSILLVFLFPLVLLMIAHTGFSRKVRQTNEVLFKRK